ncbi:MAG TPA: amino acid adenylation domain-containing protein [Thermoanaerobaculia bacterium]|nr:amino acid adenylation domain-containing protein [Thermoanaerobaculia bacterium]
MNEIQNRSGQTAEERRALLASLVARRSGSTAGQAGFVPIHRLFEAQVERTPEAPAVACEGEAVTFRELNRRANRLAHRLLRLGVGPDSVVAIRVERSTEMILGLLAVLKAGGAYLPLEPSHPWERHAAMLAGARAGVLLTRASSIGTGGVAELIASRVRELAGFAPTALPLDASAGGDALVDDGDPEHGPGSGPAPGNLAYVLYTSGSTGEPKGVAVTQEGISRYVQAVVERFELAGCASYAMVSTFSADLGNTVLFPPLCFGGCLHVIAEERAMHPAHLADYFTRHAIDCLKIVPSHLRALLTFEHPERLLPRRRLILGGEAATPDLVAWLHRLAPDCRVFNHYGPTETTVGVSTWRCDAAAGEPGPIPLGFALPHAELYLLDANQLPVPVDVPGELCVGGAALARGYLHRPDLTAERFIPNPLGTRPGARLYRTGDLARRLPGGSLELLGRIDQQVKIRGFRVEPREVEAALRAHPQVRDAVVIAREPLLPESGGKHLVAYLVADEALGDEEVRAFLHTRLPEPMVPAELVRLAALPLNANGKVDLRALPAPERRSQEDAFVAPRNRMEQILAEVWASVLGRERVGVNEEFLALGGDSILAIQVVARAHQRGVRITLRQLFERLGRLTVATLAAGAELAGEPGAAPQQAIRLTPGQREFLERESAARGIENGYPLSPMQQGMLFHSLYAGTSGDYISQIGFRLAGGFDRQAFVAAWEAVWQRYPILRTALVWKEVDEPLQVVCSHLELPLAERDLRGLAPATQDHEIEHHLERLRREGGRDLSRPPLLHLGLFQLDEETYQFTASYHHLLLDGWSLSRVLEESQLLYEANRQGRTLELPRLRPYRDYILWLQEQDLERAEAFWRRTLAGFRSATPLGNDLAPDSLPGEEEGYAQQTVSLSRPELARLRDVARRHGVTLNTAIQGAWALLLGHYSGAEDVLFGNVTSGRPPALEGVESIVGLLINTLPVRVPIPPAAPLFSWLGELQARQAELLEYEFSPLAKVQQWSEVPAGQGLFRSVLVFVAISKESWGGQDWSLSQTGYPLNLVVITAESGLTLGITYGLRHFDAVSAARLGGHWRSLLEAMIEGDDRCLASLPVLTAAERHQLIEWNDAAAAGREAAFSELFAAQVRRTPEEIAVRCQGEELSYAQLSRRAQELAVRLVRHGAGPERIVALLAARGLDLLVGILGAFQAGAAYLPLDGLHPAARHAAILTGSGAAVLLATGEMQPVAAAALDALDGLAAGPRPVSLSLTAAAAAGEESGPLAPPLGAPPRLAYVIYTSGSTGVPKGAMIEHRGMLNHLLAKIEDLDLTAADRIAQTASQCFDISVWQLLAPLLVGGRVEIFPDEVARDPGLLLAGLKRAGITVLEMVPALLHELLEAAPPAEAWQSLRWLIATGEALPFELAERWCERVPDVPLLNAYGPTECSDDVSHGWMSEGSSGGRLAHVSIGRPIANTQLHVLDRHLRPVPGGVTGELYVGGIGVGRGYTGDPARTAESFVPDPFGTAPEGSRLYRTGDLARFLVDGRLDLLGRIDHQVKVRGFRIELGEIEAALRQAPGVQQAVATVWPDAGGGSDLAAYVVLDGAGTMDGTELRRHLRERLPEYMVPPAIVILESLPLSRNGKVDRLALPRPERSGDPGEEGRVAPRDALEETLVRIWQETLKVNELGVTDNYFALGGHSILALRLMAVIQKETGHEIPISALFKGPTIAELAEVLRREEGSSLWSSLVEIQAGGSRRPFFAIHPTGGDVLCYYHLSRCLGPDQPFYGLQARGLDGRQKASAQIPEMAARYVEAIRGVQPHGPYQLGGWSFGGVVVFEMARQLEAAGEEVGIAALFDSVAPISSSGDDPSRLDRRQWAEWFVLIGGEMDNVLGLHLGITVEAFVGLAAEQQLGEFLVRLDRADFMPQSEGASLGRGFWEVHRGNTEAMLHYAKEAPDYSGRVTLFRTQGASVLADSHDRTVHDNPFFGWDRLVSGEIEVHEVPGNHNTIMSHPFVEHVAARLRECLDLIP